MLWLAYKEAKAVIHFRDCSASNQVLHNDCLNPAPPSEIPRRPLPPRDLEDRRRLAYTGTRGYRDLIRRLYQPQ
jgi:hypothetical protein